MAHVRLFRHYIHLPYAILGLIDFLVLAFAFALAVFFRYFGDVSFFLDNLSFLLPSAVVFSAINLLVMVALGVHQSRLEEGMSGMMLRTILALMVSIPLCGFAYLLSNEWLWYIGTSSALTTGSVFGFFLLGIARLFFLLPSAKNASNERCWCWGLGSVPGRFTRTSERLLTARALY